LDASREKAVNTLLSRYRLWGVMAMISLVTFICLLSAAFLLEGVSYGMLLLVLFSGFLWMGATALCRHSLVALKHAMGRRLTVGEFLSTQLVALSFPLAYPRVRREAAAFLKETGAGSNDLQSQ
jgi:hypothetical protein